MSDKPDANFARHIQNPYASSPNALSPDTTPPIVEIDGMSVVEQKKADDLGNIAAVWCASYLPVQLEEDGTRRGHSTGKSLWNTFAGCCPNAVKKLDDYTEGEVSTANFKLVFRSFCTFLLSLQLVSNVES
jgi:hypothetical protein